MFDKCVCVCSIFFAGFALSEDVAVSPVVVDDFVKIVIHFSMYVDVSNV